MTQIHKPVRLGDHQLQRACALLARAFHEDPLMIFVAPDGRRRARLLPGFFEMTVRYCLRYGVVYTTPELEGVACWLPPGNTTPTLGRILSVGIHVSPLLLGLSGLRRIGLTERYAAQVHERLMRGPHWYLWALGVDPACQGRGVGSALLTVVLQEAARQGQPCYLETQNARNVGYYEHHGFRVVSAEEIPGSRGLQMWAMLHEGTRQSR
jgi:ribosomal protein S18 acetylase RimI-like enzyme